MREVATMSEPDLLLTELPWPKQSACVLCGDLLKGNCYVDISTVDGDTWCIRCGDEWYSRQEKAPSKQDKNGVDPGDLR